MDTDIPEDREVLPAFEQIHAFGIESEHRPADAAASDQKRENRPVGKIPLSGPAHRRVSLDLVEILDVRGIDGAFLKAKATQPSIDRDDIKDPVHTKGDRQSPIFG